MEQMEVDDQPFESSMVEVVEPNVSLNRSGFIRMQPVDEQEGDLTFPHPEI